MQWVFEGARIPYFLYFPHCPTRQQIYLFFGYFDTQFFFSQSATFSSRPPPFFPFIAHFLSILPRGGQPLPVRRHQHEPLRCVSLGEEGLYINRQICTQIQLDARTDMHARTHSHIYLPDCYLFCQRRPLRNHAHMKTLT